MVLRLCTVFYCGGKSIPLNRKPVIDFKEFTLENGLRVIVHEDYTTPMAVLNVLYDGGSKDEDEAETGFVDELLYEGTLRAREEAKSTLLAAKQAMGLAGVWNRISRGAERRRKKSEATV